MEWKADRLNERSINVARRLGFIFEGVHRQPVVYKGRSRDTAWLSSLGLGVGGVEAPL